MNIKNNTLLYCYKDLTGKRRVERISKGFMHILAYFVFASIIQIIALLIESGLQSALRDTLNSALFIVGSLVIFAFIKFLFSPAYSFILTTINKRSLEKWNRQNLIVNLFGSAEVVYPNCVIEKKQEKHPELNVRLIKMALDVSGSPMVLWAHQDIFENEDSFDEIHYHYEFVHKVV